jgi:hypothetical protein
MKITRWPSQDHKKAAYRLMYDAQRVGPPTRLEHETLMWIARQEPKMRLPDKVRARYDRIFEAYARQYSRVYIYNPMDYEVTPEGYLRVLSPTPAVSWPAMSLERMKQLTANLRLMSSAT